MKLELKHLAPYLPYGLYVLHTIWEEVLLMNITGSGITPQVLSIADVEEFAKPILRPLDGIYSEIATDKGVHVPAIELLGISYKKKSPSDVYNYIKNGNLMYRNQEILISLHFDVFCLIDAGLAISYEEAGLL